MKAATVAFCGDSYLADPSTGVNGSQVQMYNLSTALAKRGMEVHVVAITKDPLAGSKKYGESEGVRLHWVARKNKLIISSEVRAFQRALDEIRPAAVYTRGRSHLLFAASDWANRHGRLSVWGTNGEDSCEFWKNTKLTVLSRRPLLKKIARLPYAVRMDRLIHRGVRSAGAVVNQTEYQKERLMKNFGKDGVVLPSYYVPPKAEELPGREKLVLFLGNLGPVKQPEIFLDLAEECKELGGWKFALVGPGRDTRYTEEIAVRARSLPNVELVGEVAFTETWKWLGRAALLVNTSTPQAEGLPNAFVQAWLAGIPVASLHRDPNGWVARNTLGICAHGSLGRFREECIALMQDDLHRNRIGEICRRFALRTFSSETIIDRYMEIIDGGRSVEGEGEHAEL
jgi:glycosyltransferase involved in cell wall biosynthesis